MINLRSEICRKIKEARRELGLSQVVVAAEVGCHQSALSAFEQGDGTKLSDEVVERLAKKFKVDLTAEVPHEGDSVARQPVMAPPVPGRIGSGFCPNPNCPTNRGYSVEGRAYYLPDRRAADPVGGKFCALCGEILERACPNCGAPVHEGGVCSLCGKPYVS